MILEYARRGCESVQLHTFFQLPLSQYPATQGSRTQRALHALVFHPNDGLIAGLLELEAAGGLERRGGELCFLDLTTDAPRVGCAVRAPAPVPRAAHRPGWAAR